MVRVKICGITNAEDAKDAAALGADALGFIFADSPRKITEIEARAIVKSLPPFISCVGLFVNESIERVKAVCEFCALHTIQLHGDEPPEYLYGLTGYKIIKAFRVVEQASSLLNEHRQDACATNGSMLDTLKEYSADAFLLDGYAAGKMGGTGASFPWEIARGAKRLGQIIIAGGLTPENIADAVTIAHPYAVDVSSGVEARPGKKDKGLMKRFIATAKGIQV